MSSYLKEGPKISDELIIHLLQLNIERQEVIERNKKSSSIIQSLTNEQFITPEDHWSDLDRSLKWIESAKIKVQENLLSNSIWKWCWNSLEPPTFSLNIEEINGVISKTQSLLDSAEIDKSFNLSSNSLDDNLFLFKNWIESSARFCYFRHRIGHSECD
jgi:hypothetical protein